MEKLKSSDFESLYFGEVKKNPLIELGILEDKPKEPTGIAADVINFKKEKEKKGFLEKATDFVSEPFSDIKTGLKEFGSDVRKIQTGREDETKGFLGRMFERSDDTLNKIVELNKAVDETGGSEFDKKILAGLTWIGAGVDFTGDVFMSGLKTIAPQGVEDFTEENIKKFMSSETGKVISDVIKEGGEKIKEFEESSPEAKRLSLTIKALMPPAELALGGTGGKLIKEGIETGVDASITAGKEGIEKSKDLISGINIPEISNPLKRTESDIPEEFQTELGIVNGQEVQVPKVDRTLTEKTVKLFENKSNKQLAGRAVSPRTLGKNDKQKLKTIADVENRTRNLYNNVRTGVLDGDISTLENTAQTIVNNLDTIGARIGEGVKKVDGNIQIDNNLTDSMIDALNTKGVEVSPAAPILQKFYDSLGDGNLTIQEAYELKKAYSNEVSKLYKSGDAGTSQFKALSDGVEFLNTKIDEIIDTQLGEQFANDKILYRDLKNIVSDITASALVEGRRSPESFAERIGKVESLFSPVSSTKQKLIQTSDELNTRGGAWAELIKRYDEEAIKNAKNK